METRVDLPDPSAFWPALKTLRKQGWEVELWLAGTWATLYRKIHIRKAMFPNPVEAVDWSIDVNDPQRIHTKAFEHLRWVHKPGKPPVEGPWFFIPRHVRGAYSQMWLIGYR